MDISRLDVARGVIAGAVALAVVANLAQFVQIERDMGRTYAAINRYETSDVVDVVSAHTPTVRQRFELYTTLRHWARGADILIGPNAGLQRDQLAGLAGMGELRDWDGSHDLGPDEDERITAHAVVEGEDRWAGAYRLAVADRAPSLLVAMRVDDGLLLVDDRLLEGFEP